MKTYIYRYKEQIPYMVLKPYEMESTNLPSHLWEYFLHNDKHKIHGRSKVFCFTIPVLAVNNTYIFFSSSGFFSISHKTFCD